MGDSGLSMMVDSRAAAPIPIQFRMQRKQPHTAHTHLLDLLLLVLLAGTTDTTAATGLLGGGLACRGHHLCAARARTARREQGRERTQQRQEGKARRPKTQSSPLSLQRLCVQRPQLLDARTPCCTPCTTAAAASGAYAYALAVTARTATAARRTPCTTHQRTTTTTACACACAALRAAQSFEVTGHQLSELLQEAAHLRVVLELALRLLGVCLQQLHGRHALGVAEAAAQHLVALESLRQVRRNPVCSGTVYIGTSCAAEMSYVSDRTAAGSVRSTMQCYLSA